MIDVVLVAADDETGVGIQRLLEQDGDVRVVGRLRSLEEVKDHTWNDALVVVGPGMVESEDSLARISPSHRRMILLTPGLPRTERHNGVIEVAMELTGKMLREAIRNAAVDSGGP